MILTVNLLRLWGNGNVYQKCHKMKFSKLSTVNGHENSVAHSIPGAL